MTVVLTNLSIRWFKCFPYLLWISRCVESLAIGCWWQFYTGCKHMQWFWCVSVASGVQALAVRCLDCRFDPSWRKSYIEARFPLRGWRFGSVGIIIIGFQGGGFSLALGFLCPKTQLQAHLAMMQRFARPKPSASICSVWRFGFPLEAAVRPNMQS